MVNTHAGSLTRLTYFYLKSINKSTFNVPQITDPQQHHDISKDIYINGGDHDQPYKKYSAKKQQIIVNVHQDNYQDLKQAQNKLSK